MHGLNNNVGSGNSTGVGSSSVPFQHQSQQQSMIASLSHNSSPLGGGSNSGNNSMHQHQTISCPLGGSGGNVGAGDRASSNTGIQPRYLSSPAAAAAVYAATTNVNEHGPNNFATIRTTSIVTKQQKEHMQVSKRINSNL